MLNKASSSNVNKSSSNKKASTVKCILMCNPDNQERHTEYFEWLLVTTEKLQKALLKYI